MTGAHSSSGDGARSDVDAPSDILTVFRVSHPHLALTRTVEHDRTARLRPIREAGTDPTTGRYLYCVCSEDFDRFEQGLREDPTVREFERVLVLENTGVYAVTYTDDVLLFSTEVVRANGVVLDIRNDGTTWVLKTWLPGREAARRLWEFADARGVEMTIERINEHASIVPRGYGLTASQREALLTALESGYFEEPRGASLEEIASELDVSQPSVSGLLRRGFRQLLLATVAEGEDAGGDCLEPVL